jgi:hypothetical protein
LVHFCFQIFANILNYWHIFVSMKEAKEKKLIIFFQNKDGFSRAELFNYFVQVEGELNEGTFGWRIHDLKKKNIIHEIKRGLYTLNAKPVYVPAVDDKIKKLAAIFTENYRHARYCLWNISWLNEFTVHQFNRELFLFETEKDLEESLAHTLSDNGYNNVIWSVKATHLSIINAADPIVILPLISRAPIQEIETEEKKAVSLPTLEKILVDIYKDEKLFYFVKGAEMEKIFKHAFDRYSINYTTFFGYAKRRGKDTDLHAYLLNHFPELLKNISR